MLSLGGVEGKNWALRRVADLLDVLWPSLAIVQGGGDNQDRAIQEVRGGVAGRWACLANGLDTRCDADITITCTAVWGSLRMMRG
jgi:hypothetical protein